MTAVGWSIVFETWEGHPVLRVVRLIALCLIGLLGVHSMLAAFTQKKFHWRGGGLMPVWLGHIMSVLAGLLFIGLAVLLLGKK